MEALKDPGYVVRVSNDTLKKFRYIIDTGLEEEFAVFTISKRVKNVFTMHGFILPKQFGTYTTVEVEGEDLLEEILASGLDVEIVRGHIHYHPKMSVRPSVKDISEIKEAAITGGFATHIILNDVGDIFCHVADMENNIYIQDVDVEVFYSTEEEESFLDYKNANIKDLALQLCTEDEQEEIDSILDELVTMSNYSLEDFSNEYYPLTSLEKQSLDEGIASKIQVNRYSRSFGAMNKGDYWGSSKKYRFL